jgi:hypothetical protein
MLCTKPPPKRVVIFALRWSSRMTVSEPETFGASRRAAARAEVLRDGEPRAAGALPAPRRSRRAAPRALRGARQRRAAGRSSERRRHCGCGRGPHGVAVERPVDRLDVEHVVPAREALGQQVREVGAVADREEEPGAEPHFAPMKRSRLPLKEKQRLPTRRVRRSFTVRTPDPLSATATRMSRGENLGGGRCGRCAG